MKYSTVLARIILALAIFLSQAAATNAEIGDAIKLNGDLVDNGNTVGSSARISPDSRTVFYRADQDTDGINELFATPINRSAPVKQHADLGVVGGNISTTELSPDGEYLVFLQSDSNTSFARLYSKRLPNGLPQALTASLPQGQGVSRFSIDPSSSHVVFVGDIQTDDTKELFSVPIDGSGTVLQLSPANPLAGANVPQFMLSEDGTKVVFFMNDTDLSERRLFSSPITTASPTLISAAEPEGQVEAFLITPDSASVVFTARADFADRVELYSTPIGGGSIIKISDSLLASNDRAFLSSSISGDSTYVAYRVETSSTGQRNVYSSRIDGVGSPLKLNSDLPVGATVESIIVSKEANRVIYRADQDTLDLVELYSVPFDSNANVKLNGPQPAFGGVKTYYRATPDGTRVFFRADPTLNARFDLFSAPIDGSAPATEFFAPESSAADVDLNFVFSPDSEHIAFIQVSAKPNPTPDAHEMFLAPVDGGSEPVRVSGDLVDGGTLDGSPALFSSDSKYLLYQATQDDSDQLELYSVSLDAGELCWAIKTQNSSVVSLCL